MEIAKIKLILLRDSNGYIHCQVKTEPTNYTIPGKID